MHRADSGSKYRYLQTLLATTALVSAGAGYAQTNAERQDSESAVLEEIIVRGTATKFRPDEQTSATGLNMSLIETPQSITVLTTEMLRQINADSVYEATDLVPNVQRTGFGFGLSQIVLRGIRTTRRRLNGLEMDNPVTTIRSYATERSEVVRGPATAIYGVTGGFGGEINSILKVPDNRFRAEVEVNAGNYGSQQYKFDVTGPIPGTDGTVSGRLVGLYEEYDHTLDIKGESFPNYQSMVLGSVQWEPTDRTVFRLSYYHSDRNVDPQDGGVLVQNEDGTRLSIPDVNPDFWFFSHPDDSTERTEVKVGFLELEHNFNNGMYARTKVMLEYYDHELEYFFPFGPFGAFGLADDEVYIYSYDVERDGERLTFSQSLGGEFELAGQVHQFFAAVEYNDDQDPDRFELAQSEFFGFAKIDWLSDDVFDGETIRFSDGAPFTPTQGDRDELFPVAKLENEKAEDLKVSLQVLLNPTDRLQILAGGLFQDNETLDVVPVVSSERLDPPRRTETSFQEAVFRVGVTYDVSDWVAGAIIDDMRVYYSFTQGFEPQVLIDDEGVGQSAPQDMKQHEAGIKAELFDSAVGVSLAGFTYEITNIAVFNSFLGGFGGFARQVLAGTQEANGIEFELTGEILPGWNVSANYAYMDAVIIDPNFDPIAPTTTPEHSGAITTAYEFLRGPVEGLRLGATFKASGDYTFVSPNNQRFGADPHAGSHQRFDINLAYAPPSGRLQGFEVFLNLQNVFDEDIIVSKQSSPAFGIMFIDRRQVTAGLRYTFE